MGEVQVFHVGFTTKYREGINSAFAGGRCEDAKSTPSRFSRTWKIIDDALRGRIRNQVGLKDQR